MVIDPEDLELEIVHTSRGFSRRAKARELALKFDRRKEFSSAHLTAAMRKYGGRLANIPVKQLHDTSRHVTQDLLREGKLWRVRHGWYRWTKEEGGSDA